MQGGRRGHPRPSRCRAAAALSLGAHSRRLLATLLLAALPGAGAASGQLDPLGTGEAKALVQPAAVFGSDERVPVPPHLKALEGKIGLLFNTRARVVCTAFCAAGAVVVTAAHCLYRTTGEVPPRLEEFRFARNYGKARQFERIAGSGRGAAAQHVMAGSMDLKVLPPIDASNDWALVRLARPACSHGVLPIRALSGEAIIAAAAAKRIFQVSYHRDFRPWRVAYSQACGVARSFEAADATTIARDFADPNEVLLHTCDTGGASSGSPLLLQTATGPEVVGINVGTYVQSKVLIEEGQVIKRLKPDTVANTAVNSSRFASKLAAFEHAAILGSSAEISALQKIMQRHDLYAGPIDGSYGAGLRAAIAAYESAHGMMVTGLATQALLQRLTREQPLTPAVP
jgi:Putative peptidoglycan binding domain/Trypsin-like peptidase domain